MFAAMPSILLETPGLLAIYKPPNVPFHSSDSQPGILRLIREHRQSTPGCNPPEERLYPVHRLDAVTSGIMLLAKRPEVAQELMTAFRSRQVHKYYVALSRRRPAKKEGSVVGDMRRGRRGSWMLERSTSNAAVTRFASVGVPGAPGLRAFLLKPETGRTHQLRVALKALGSPVCGDVRYSSKEEAVAEDRTYLHAAALRTVVGGRLVQVVCLPTEGREFLTTGFKEAFREWLPAALEQDQGVWFPDKKLLRSSPEVLSPAGLADTSYMAGTLSGEGWW